ncbi:MAG: hypothetical protein ACYDGN_09310 [Acidimicrobiales bacterium]
MDPTVDRWAFLAEALPYLLQPGCARVAVTDQATVVGYVTRAHIEAELRRRASQEEIEQPTLRWLKLPSVAPRTPADASFSEGPDPSPEEDRGEC